MKSILTIILGVLFSACILLHADQDPVKPTVYMTEGPDQVTYYNVPRQDPDKFTVVLLSWAKYRSKYSFGWRYDQENGWIKETFTKENTSYGINTWISPHLGRLGGDTLIINRTISAPPSKK